MKPSFLLFSLLTLASAGAWAQRQGYPQPSYPQQHYPQPPSVQITINPAPVYQQPYRYDSRTDQWRAKCRRLRRDPEQLIKISTCGSWKLFEDVTKQQGLDITHPCKWYFGDYRTDMDEWEKILVDEYRFGKKVLV